jgi:hypothetical protein
MRRILLFPFTTLVAVAAGCGLETREHSTRSDLKRDLTLVIGSAQVEVASPMETRQLRSEHRAVPSKRSSRPVSTSSLRQPTVKLAVVRVPAPVLSVPEPVPQPVATPASSDNDRELLPGKTITLIPASSGPSIDTDRTGDLPEIHGRPMVRVGGGTCRGRGRGPGIGIATGPRPDFR